MTTIRNRHSKIVDKKPVSRNSVPRPKFHLVVKTRIFLRPAIGTAREAPIQNRHFNPVSTRSDSEISSSAPKFGSGSVVAGSRCDRIRTPLRSNGYNFPLDYQNRL
ncbi:hypothetical protein Taro_054345 [Colocasia esculenta]|uniref:Uncharacterized protein n=1 Tax=Colocasia esculenta TaxID=4460 RepID=A0A843XQX0_COLES|nr:hypothetical protein [Colocasia esculenta]